MMGGQSPVGGDRKMRGRSLHQWADGDRHQEDVTRLQLSSMRSNTHHDTGSKHAH